MKREGDGMNGSEMVRDGSTGGRDTPLATASPHRGRTHPPSRLYSSGSILPSANGCEMAQKLKISIAIDPEVRDAVARLAEEQRRSVSWIINDVLRQDRSVSHFIHDAPSRRMAHRRGKRS